LLEVRGSVDEEGEEVEVLLTGGFWEEYECVDEILSEFW
jgi:hypothetical protein